MDVSPGMMVKVVKGPFADMDGVVLDPIKPADAKGRPLPVADPGCWLVMLTMNDTPFPFHLHKNLLEPAATMA